MNHGLRHTKGDLVLLLDADHVPCIDLLDRCVPWFVLHDDVFLVQTPHFMVNPDPIERNLLQSFHRMPSESDMFYHAIQPGLDIWASSFFCGSAGLLRRRHLDEVGGLVGQSITEDTETALELHRKGYRSIYIDRPMVAGLAPGTFAGFVSQRMRWAQGMTQILLLKRPFLGPGLSWFQRVCYMSAVLFWLFPFARMVFLLAPLAYLLFGLQVYNASAAEILAYTVPHVIAIYVVSDMLFGRTRWPVISELYEVMQSIFSAKAVAKVVANPRKPSFVVTPKGEALDRSFISPLAWPFYIICCLMLLGFLGGAYRLHAFPLTRELTTVVLLWNGFNFLVVLAALGALLERRQRRSSPRMPANQQAVLVSCQGSRTEVTITDLSATGARLNATDAGMALLPGQELRLQAFSFPLGREVELRCQVRSVVPSGKEVDLGVRFLVNTSTDADLAVALCFGDSARWRYFQERRSRPIPFGAAVRLNFRLIWAPVLQHVALAARVARQRLPHLLRRTGRARRPRLPVVVWEGIDA